MRFPRFEAGFELFGDFSVGFLDLRFKPAAGSVAVGAGIVRSELVAFDDVPVFFLVDFAPAAALTTGPEVGVFKLVSGAGPDELLDDPVSDVSELSSRSLREPAHGYIIRMKCLSASGHTQRGMNMKTYGARAFNSRNFPSRRPGA